MSFTESKEWIRVRRELLHHGFSPIVTIRSNGDIAASADFVRMANIETCTRVNIYLSADGMKVAFRFHSSNLEYDAFIFGPDGGGTNKKVGRVIQCSAFKRQSRTISVLCKEGRAARKFEPYLDHNRNWVINLIPCFEHIFTSRTEILPGSTGIYRYLNDKEIIYVGRGELRSRFAAVERKEWKFNIIEYSILNDDALERHWESFWLNEYRKSKGTWPFHNKIGGTVIIKDSKNG